MIDKLGIFIFRKDLRLSDNLALIKLTKECNNIIPIFIFDDYQINITKTNKYYRSNNAIQFMCESLIDLNKQLDNKLMMFKGNPINILERIINILKLKYNNIYVGFNLDFSKYSLKRDQEIELLLQKNNVNIITSDNDQSLLPLDKLIKKDGNAYMVYGAFYKNALLSKVNNPIRNSYKNYIKCIQLKEYIITKEDFQDFYIENKYLAQRGGRALGLKTMYNTKVYKEYNIKRDLLDFKTYNISAYINFGCISIREFYHIIKSNIELTKQLYWRDFYLCILRLVPNANSYSLMLDTRYNKVKWNNITSTSNEYKYWNLLIKSQTGYLIIDAGMKELIKTGYIGNRIRLILATFWIKYLLINPLHPKYGSQVGFSKYLVDCSTSQNKLNHQWFTDLDLPGRRYAKKGCNSLTGRMMRIDNEIIKKFDPECKYIKKWLPELINVPNKDLYKWNDIIQKKYKLHVSPIFNWEERYLEYCKLFKNI